MLHIHNDVGGVTNQSSRTTALLKYSILNTVHKFCSKSNTHTALVNFGKFNSSLWYKFFFFLRLQFVDFTLDQLH